MKKSKLITTALAPIVLAAPLGTLTGLTACNKNKGKTKSDNVEKHVFSINDLHGAAPGFGDEFFNKNSRNNAGMARIVNEIRPTINKCPGSIFVSAGDTNAGESFSTSQQGESLYPVLKAAQVAFSAVGNHAWDYGLDKLEDKVYDKWARNEKTEGNWFLASNILYDHIQLFADYQWKYDDNDYHLWNLLRVKWADPYKIVDMDGHKVCFIGLTTHDTVTDGNREALTTTTIMDKSYYNTAVGFSKRLAKENLGDEEYKKIEAFMLLTHCDSEQDATTGAISGEATYIAEHAHENNSEIDGIISAHSHKVVSGTVKNSTLNKNIWIGQAGVSGQKYLDTKITFDDTKDVGKRLKNIEMKVITPYIAGRDIKDMDESREEAAKQLFEITDHPADAIAARTITTFEEWKTVVRENLEIPMCKCTKEGMPYWYYSHDNGASIGTTWLQSDTLVEPTGVWATLAQTLAFNAKFAGSDEENPIFPASISLNNIDSYKSYIPEADEATGVNKEFGYALHPYENKIRYGCLKPHQLKQYINYFLDGGNDIFNYKDKVQYATPEGEPIDFYYDEGKQQPIQWGAKELVADPKDHTKKVQGVCTSCGCIQFFGMSFAVKQKGTRVDPLSKKPIYELDDTKDIRIYTQGKDLANPEQWGTIDAVASSNSGYIPITLSSFCWQGGNAQNRMLNHWFEYNYENEPDETAKGKIKCREFDYYTRQTAFDYMEAIGGEQHEGNINQFPESQVLLDSNYCKKLVRINEQ